ncbi:hypothetical protein Q7P37_011427 [Cladosporium fusiforme]
MPFLTNGVNGTSSPVDASSEASQSSMTQNHERLEIARKRISESCASYAYFSPVWYSIDDYPTYHTSPDPNHDRFQPPNPETMKRDLQTFFERVKAFESAEAYAVYEQLAIEVRDMANDEYSGFNWEYFQDAVAKAVTTMGEKGFLIEVHDLVTLPLVAESVQQTRATEQATA